MTFGDGRHGKLGQDENRFVNEFQPAIVERFRRIKVENASCGGCHTIVLGINIYLYFLFCSKRLIKNWIIRLIRNKKT